MFAVIGCGYWGSNHIRLLKSRSLLKYVYDINQKLQVEVSNLYNLQIKSLEEILLDNTIKFIVISTDSNSHYSLILKCLSKNKNVLVEKPLVTNISELISLKKILNSNKNKVYVGHLLTFHESVEYIQENLKLLIRKYGSIKSIETNRMNFGKIRKNESALISFIPHDLSIVSHILQSDKFSDRLNKFQYQKNIRDFDKGSLFYKLNGIDCVSNYSWISIQKKRELIIYFKKAILIFDDLMPIDEKIKIFSSKKDIIYSKKEDINSNEIFVQRKTEPLENQLNYIINNHSKKNKNDRISFKNTYKIYEFLLKND